MQEINNFRGQCGTMICFDWITVPLVYTQVRVFDDQFYRTLTRDIDIAILPVRPSVRRVLVIY